MDLYRPNLVLYTVDKVETLKPFYFPGIGHLYINRHVDINSDDVMDMFGRKQRRLDFVL